MVAGYNARQIVDPPVFTPSPYGLLSTVDIRPTADMHWQLGVTWEDVCGGAGTVVVDCATSAPAVTGSGMIGPKSAVTSRSFWGATPFTVFVEIDCSPIDFYQQRDSIISTAMDRFESFAVERAFWTGFALDRNGSGGVANVVLPHLAANTAITEVMGGTPTKTITLQQSATVVTGAALNVVDALGALEGALAACLNGTGTIHVPQALAPTMALLLQRQGSRLVTPNGNNIAIGAGYPGTSPAGAAPALGSSWMYATGPVFAYRSTPMIVGDPFQNLDRSTNSMKVIIERTYVMGYDCCLFAQLVNTSSFIATSTSTP